MAGEDGVGAFAAGGEGGTLVVADGYLEDSLAGAVVDGEAYVDGRDINHAHDAVTTYIQQGLIGIIFPLTLCHRGGA